MMLLNAPAPEIQPHLRLMHLMLASIQASNYGVNDFLRCCFTVYTAFRTDPQSTIAA